MASAVSQPSAEPIDQFYERITTRVRSTVKGRQSMLPRQHWTDLYKESHRRFTTSPKAKEEAEYVRRRLAAESKSMSESEQTFCANVWQYPVNWLARLESGGTAAAAPAKPAP